MELRHPVTDIGNQHLEIAPNFKLIIHKWSHRSAASQLSDNSTLLRTGREIAESVRAGATGWVSPTHDVSLTAPSATCGYYVYSGLAPALSLAETRDSTRSWVSPKPWGAPVSDDEIYDLAELGEFESSDFSDLTIVPTTDLHVLRHTQNAITGLPREASSARGESPAKRKMDVNSLHSVLPQPHFHPSLYIANSVTPRIPPYTAATCIPIPPYRDLHPPLSLYSRCTWIIPIRGHLPWDCCSAGHVLASPSQLPVAPDPDTARSILWTHHALTAFWEFLRKLRESRSVGSLGLSFHLASSQTRSLADQQYTSPAFPSGNGEVMSGIGNQAALLESATSSHNGFTSIVPTSSTVTSLASVDHLKIYHEAPNSMHVRNALHAWSYVAPHFEGGVVASGKPQKIRMLKGAKLVLVNEKSKGILIA